MFPAMEADEGRNRHHGAGSPANCTRRKILNRAYRAAMWCPGSSPVPRITRLSTLMSQRGRASAALLFLGDDNVFGCASSASVAVPTIRETKVGLWQRTIWYDRCNFAARFLNCALINYPGTRETSVGQRRHADQQHVG